MKLEFRNPLIVSCQDWPVFGMVREVLSASVGGLRLNDPVAVNFARAMGCKAPIIGCWKKDGHITPDIDMIGVLAKAGATAVAFECRKNAEENQARVEECKKAGVISVVDCGSTASAQLAKEAGADYIATTLWPALHPDEVTARELCRDMAIIAEGNIRTPKEAREWLDAGAEAVCVGTAITAPRKITEWFVSALKREASS